MRLAGTCSRYRTGDAPDAARQDPWIVVQRLQVRVPAKVMKKMPAGSSRVVAMVRREWMEVIRQVAQVEPNVRRQQSFGAVTPAAEAPRWRCRGVDHRHHARAAPAEAPPHTCGTCRDGRGSRSRTQTRVVALQRPKASRQAARHTARRRDHGQLRREAGNWRSRPWAGGRSRRSRRQEALAPGW